MPRCWYAYNGVGDPLLISSYSLVGIKPGCINGSRVCAIYTPNCGPTPALLSANIRNYIADLLITLVAQPNGGLGVKKYVYGKN